MANPKKPVTVIDLSTVPFDVRPTVAAQIGRLAFEFNFWNPQYPPDKQEKATLTMLEQAELICADIVDANTP